MKLVGAILTVCAVASCSATDLQVRPAKATRLAEDFRNVCLAHPRDDAGVKAAAAARGISVWTVAKPDARVPSKSVWLNERGNGQAWSCLVKDQDSDNLVTAHALTNALREWADGEPVHWAAPEVRARIQQPLLYSASRHAGNDLYKVRANHLRGDLVFYFEVVSN